jgi:uncharacterized protein (DUF433 family)
MATLDWSQCPVVESVPGRLNGAWVFRDTRLPVSAVFENLEAGATVDQITEWFDIAKDQVIEVLDFAARSVAAPVVAGKTSSHDARPV